MPYELLVDDNFHFMDESYRFSAGTFDRYEDAVAKAQAMIDGELVHMLKGKDGVSADELYDLYMGFGNDPFIAGEPQPEEIFSASTYARERCLDLCE